MNKILIVLIFLCGVAFAVRQLPDEVKMIILIEQHKIPLNNALRGNNEKKNLPPVPKSEIPETPVNEKPEEIIPIEKTEPKFENPPKVLDPIVLPKQNEEKPNEIKNKMPTKIVIPPHDIKGDEYKIHGEYKIKLKGEKTEKDLLFKGIVIMPRALPIDHHVDIPVLFLFYGANKDHFQDVKAELKGHIYEVKDDEIKMKLFGKINAGGEIHDLDKAKAKIEFDHDEEKEFEIKGKMVDKADKTKIHFKGVFERLNGEKFRQHKESLILHQLIFHFNQLQNNKLILYLLRKIKIKQDK